MAKRRRVHGPDAPVVDLDRALAEKTQVSANIGQDVIVTTADRLRISLLKYQEGLLTKRQWIAPTSIFLALVTTLAAAKFQDFILDAPTWRALYILLALLSIGWLFRTIYRSIKYRKCSPEQFINDIKA